MTLKSDENTLKRLIFITSFFIILTACAWTALPSGYAQLASATNSTAAAQTSSPSQLSLRYIEFPYDIFFVGEPITMRVGPIMSNQTGEYKAVAVVTPQIGGVESSYESFASYSKDSNWFTFNFVLREAGNYTIIIWQGGVKQLTREISVCNTTSTGGGATKPDTAVSILAAQTAEEAARSAQTVDHISPPAGGSGADAISTPSLGVSIIILMAIIFSLFTIFNILKRSSKDVKPYERMNKLMID
jgi:hypothetical protein